MENKGYTVIKLDKTLTHIFNGIATVYTSDNKIVEYMEYLVSIGEAKLIGHDSESRLYETEADNVDITPFDEEIANAVRDNSEKPYKPK